MTPQSFPTQAAKDAALLELADWIIYNKQFCLTETWLNECEEYERLKSVPVEPVLPGKSAEEVLCEFICLEYYELAERLDQHIMTPNEALKAMHQYAAQSVQVPSEDAKKIIDETTEAHPYRQRGKPETYSDYNQGWEDACDILGNRIMELLTK